MAMHAARPERSPRLQRVLAVLADGRARTTRQIVRQARVMAVSACIAELRQHGARIACWQEVDAKGRRRWWYRMDRGPQGGETGHG
jgi:hypothetical protein